VDPIAFTADGEGRVVVDVHQVVRTLEGELISEGEVQHVYTIRDGLVERMDIRETRGGSAAARELQQEPPVS
jgi:hypothetical protein